MIKHLAKTPWAIWCEPRTQVDATARLPHRSSNATEATCLRCLQLAVLGFERDLLDAKVGGK